MKNEMEIFYIREIQEEGYSMENEKIYIRKVKEEKCRRWSYNNKRFRKKML